MAGGKNKSDHSGNESKSEAGFFRPKEEHQAQLIEWLTQDAALPRKQRRNAVRLHQQLVSQDYQGAYDSIQRFVKQWKEKARLACSQAFIPLEFSPGDAMQFDWSMEHVVVGGIPQTVKVGHFRLCYSRKLFVVAFPREQLEMVLEAHNRALAYFGGASKRIIYDNQKRLYIASLVARSVI